MALKKTLAAQKMQEALKRKDAEIANWRRKYSRLEKKYRELVRELEEAGFELDEEEEQQLEDENAEELEDDNEDDEEEEE